MPAQSSPDVKLEIGHVLFIDIVGYSKLLMAKTVEERSWFALQRDPPFDKIVNLALKN